MDLSRLPLLSVAALAAACVPDFDTDLSQLSEPRVLAIAALPAEAQAEKPVKLSALVAIPEGQRASRLDWSMCLARKPLTELGPVNPACLAPDDGSGAVLDLGSGDTVTATLAEDVCKLFGPLRPSPMGNEGAGRPVDPDVTGGFYQPFSVRLGERITLGSVRIDCDLANVNREDTIEYRQRYRSNENPRISELAGLDSEVRSGGKLQLRASWDTCANDSTCGDGLCTAFEDQTSCADDCTGELRGCTGAEPYVWYDRETRRVAARREGITVAWYASRGRFENEQTGLDEGQASGQSFSDNTYVASGEPGPATIWLVIRDTRGGVSWETRRITVTP